MKALIAGASGLTGSFCLTYLLESPECEEVISIGRSLLELQHPKLKQIQTDFSDIEDILENHSVDDVFCCLGSTIKKAGSKDAFTKIDFEYPLQLAKVAKENGADGFHIITALGADKKSFFFYSRVKGELEEELIKLNYNNLNIFRPSLLDGERKESRPAERFAMIVGRIFAPFLIGPLSKIRPIKAKAVSKVMVYHALKGIKGLSIIESAQIHKIYKKHHEHH
jgi:uncharacterized protein YbjT (DUF2867 family)